MYIYGERERERERERAAYVRLCVCVCVRAYKHTHIPILGFAPLRIDEQDRPRTGASAHLLATHQEHISNTLEPTLAHTCSPINMSLFATKIEKSLPLNTLTRTHARRERERERGRDRAKVIE